MKLFQEPKREEEGTKPEPLEFAFSLDLCVSHNISFTTYIYIKPWIGVL